MAKILIFSLLHRIPLYYPVAQNLLKMGLPLTISQIFTIFSFPLKIKMAAKTGKIANLISKLNFYKLIPYPMDNLLNRSAQTGPPNVRKRRPVFPPAGRSVVLCTPQMGPRTSFLSRQPDVIASFSLSKPLRPLVS